MGQKTNPTALRLEKTNQHYNSCWYSDRFYCEQLHSNYKICDYITKVFYKIKKVPYSRVRPGDRSRQQTIRLKPLIYTKINHGINQIFCIFPKFRNKLSWRKKQHKSLGKQVSTRLQNLASALPMFYGLCAYKCKIPGNWAPLSNKKDLRLLHNVNLGSTAPSPSAAYPGGTFTHKLCKDLIANKINCSLNNLNKTTATRQVEGLSPLVNALFCRHSQDFQIMGKSFYLPSGKTQGKISYSKKKNQMPFEGRKDLEKPYQSHLEKVIESSNNLDFARKVTASAGRCLVAKNSVPLAFRAAAVTRFAHRATRLAAKAPYFVANTALRSATKVNNMESRGSTPSSYPSQQGYPRGVSPCLPLKDSRLYLVKAGFAQQNCHFLAQKICNGLRNRFTFPRLRRTTLWDIKKSKYVKGVRVTLSGRVESRSKKAQKARSRTFQWGQTELHVLSSLVQFTSQHLITPRGKIGVKVWICYGT